MTKKIVRLISLTLSLCLFFSTAVFAAEPEYISNMTYEEWLVEQEAVDDSANEVTADLEPVIISVQGQETEAPQVYSSERYGIVSLTDVLQEKGRYELDMEINRDSAAENITTSITSDMDVARTAPTAGLVPVIVNEESLVDGQITTETLIAFFYNDTDEDGDAIASRYVDGNAVNFILGEIDGGFVMQITVPGSYQLYYQVEDSAGEFSRVIWYTIDVIEAPVVEEYQVFEGSFSAASDSVTYEFSIDFTEMDSAAVCLVRKGYVGTSIEVYDESGNQVFIRSTGSRQAKNWGFIDKPSADATVCNYTVVAKPKSYENRASDYRIIIGDKNDTELMMSGIENTVLLEQYYEAKTNLENSAYVPNVGEYWFKYKREATSVITILSNVSDIRFKILDASGTHVMFDSAADSDTHKTSFVGSGSFTCAEKARLNTVVGTEYYLVVYSTNPNESLSLRTGSMGTAVGNPVMCADHTKISPYSSIRINASGHTSMSFNVDGSDLPRTAQVDKITVNGVTMSQVYQWGASAPNMSSWLYSDNFSSYIKIGYTYDTTNNALLCGTWRASFLGSEASTKTITPAFSFSYYYEYGDI